MTSSRAELPRRISPLISDVRARDEPSMAPSKRGTLLETADQLALVASGACMVHCLILPPHPRPLRASPTRRRLPHASDASPFADIRPMPVWRAAGTPRAFNRVQHDRKSVV